MRKYGRAIIGESLRSDVPLLNSQIEGVAPSIFALEKHDSRSDRYTYIPTIEILEVLRKNGFFPFFVAQSKSRVPGKELFTKHMIRLRTRFDVSEKETGEIILINSCDGTSSYKLMSGVYRFVCQNGMVCGDTMNDFTVHHKGNIKNEVLENAYNVSDNFEKTRWAIDKMKAIDLYPAEKEIFAESALMIKYGEDKAPIDSSKLLSIRRYEDRQDNSLWGTLNVVQENVIKGGLRGRTSTNKKTSTREVKSIDNNVKLNKALWSLADKMAELKAGMSNTINKVNA